MGISIIPKTGKNKIEKIVAFLHYFPQEVWIKVEAINLKKDDYFQKA